ncbi:MAG: pur operon repressor [Clostridia bacterium]|nr:pur operon repressor [Clostridia bacterium]
MDKLKRNERIGALIKILSDNPSKIFTLNYFSNKFNAAKSTISEDIAIVREIVKKFDFGDIETITGAAGGVIYKPRMNREQSLGFVQELCKRVKTGDRIIAGRYLYLNDIIYNPAIVSKIGRILAQPFIDKQVDYVVTVETKGIPIALVTAKNLNVPLVIARNTNKVTEGSAVSINYISGSSNRIQTMSLSKRAIKGNTTAVIIDDFMKAGGTANGIVNLMKEFNVKVVGIGVVVEIEKPEHKLVDNYISLMVLKDLKENSQNINIHPSKWIEKGL